LLWGLVFHCLRGFCLFGTVCGWWLCLRTVLLWVAPSLPQLSPIISKNRPHHCFVVFLVEMVATSTVSELGVNTCDPIFIQESGGKYLGEQSNKRDTILGPAVFGI